MDLQIESEYASAAHRFKYLNKLNPQFTRSTSLFLPPKETFLARSN